MCKQVDILLRHLLSVHFLYAVGEKATVQAYEVRLGKLADEGGDILVLNIGIGVVLGAGCGIGSLAIVSQKLQLVHRLAVFGVTLAIEHE